MLVLMVRTCQEMGWLINFIAENEGRVDHRAYTLNMPTCAYTSGFFKNNFIPRQIVGIILYHGRVLVQFIYHDRLGVNPRHFVNNGHILCFW